MFQPSFWCRISQLPSTARCWSHPPMKPQNQPDFWGSRQSKVMDPFGTHSLSQKSWQMQCKCHEAIACFQENRPNFAGACCNFTGLGDCWWIAVDFQLLEKTGPHPWKVSMVWTLEFSSLQIRFVQTLCWRVPQWKPAAIAAGPTDRSPYLSAEKTCLRRRWSWAPHQQWHPGSGGLTKMMFLLCTTTLHTVDGCEIR